MFTAIPDREDIHVRRPRNEVDFEKMCLDVYAEVLGTTSAVRNGGRGVKQHGRDILMIDWSILGAGYGSGVWVQCKHTEKETVARPGILKDIDDAAARAREQPQAYAEVRRFIVASSGKNDKALRDEVEKKNAHGGLPFHVELHCWDWICEQVRLNNALWERYNNIRDGQVPHGLRTYVAELAMKLKGLIDTGRLADAQHCVSTWKAAARADYPDVSDLFRAAWEGHHQLRDQLLSLHQRAADGFDALAILSYANELPRQPAAATLLTYVRARRIVQGFSPDRHTGSIATGLFSDSMKLMWSLVAGATGSPDTLCALALIALVETDDDELHAEIMGYLDDLCARSRGTANEAGARVGHAVVRFHYVVRHGWDEVACRYAFGDLIDGWDEIRLHDKRLGTTFAPHEHVGVTVQGAYPLDCPSTWSSDTWTLASQLGQSAGVAPEDLAELARECKLYRIHLFSRTDEPRLSSNFEVEIETRVGDAITLLKCVHDGKIQDLARRHTVLTTERAFERILGQRAVLRSVYARTSKAYKNLLHHTESLVKLCFHSEPSTSRQQRIYVVPVYANPPRRLVATSPENAAPVTFTVSQDRLWLLERMPEKSLGTTMHAELLALYELQDEFAIACSLALHRTAPMLQFDQRKQALIAAMGIGSDSPY